jgi:phosphoribosylformylglycinamidine synthase
MPFVFLFSESAGRAMVAVPRGHEKAFTALCAERGVPWTLIGVTDTAGGELEVRDHFTVGLDELHTAFTSTLPALFGAGSDPTGTATGDVPAAAQPADADPAVDPTDGNPAATHPTSVDPAATHPTNVDAPANPTVTDVPVSQIVADVPVSQPVADVPVSQTVTDVPANPVDGDVPVNPAGPDVRVGPTDAGAAETAADGRPTGSAETATTTEAGPPAGSHPAG